MSPVFWKKEMQHQGNSVLIALSGISQYGDHSAIFCSENFRSKIVVSGLEETRIVKKRITRNSKKVQLFKLTIKSFNGFTNNACFGF